VAFWKKTGTKLPPVRLKILLVVLFMIIGLLPVLIQRVIQVNSFEQSMIEERKAEMQNQSLILSSKLSRSGYLKSGKKDSAIETEMDSVAGSFNGRIVVVDKTYAIVRDSFNLATGKYHIAPEIIRCFQGENSSKYNSEKHYIVLTTPIYDSVTDDSDKTGVQAKNDQRSVDGVLLFLASTQNMKSFLKEAENKTTIFEVIIVLLLLAVSMLLSTFLMKPFLNLRDMLGKVSAGDLNQDISQNTYVVTAQISSAINRTLQKLKAADQSKDEFVSNVSHELKTPITSIRVLADSLMTTEDAPVELYKDFMKDISAEIDRESKIIDDLLSLVKMDRTTVVLNREPVDIHIMTEQILKRLRPIAKKNGIEMTLESVREVTADVDEVKLSLAISNLIENAIKYNVKDGWVKVTLDADHQFCYIKVEDSGIGIPEDATESIFERFYRVDKARSRESGGTGLGLAITKNIILMHQGVIKVTSKPGEGSTFLVRIPLNFVADH
jgi:signal transduction histidine kinase